ncbi:hypothetical protein CW674_05260 [Macrococcoides caseolyticum]|uniref:Eco57I restriction-modification methylase domain-containing protein n=1 Tax=Macrococcoides caseolyticum TaxID=69966 RepID=UPI000C33A23E|nr:N-6 DNA methylase [Macrococcus caseolyticus]PKE65714.1 hypothetical protein CW674_05260 [Macrococcus caseolyticus]
MNTKKHNGVHFTSSVLADFISERLLTHATNHKKVVLDPACGESSLLISLSKKLIEKDTDFEIQGIDIDIESIKYSNELFKSMNLINNYNFLNADFIEVVKDYFQGNLFGDSLEIKRPNMIIANPPYVRTQNLLNKNSKELSKTFNISGKIDLYQIFIVAMVRILEDNGLIAFIVSNKFLYNKSGESIRNFLKYNLDILEIIDLGDTKLFSASVLPVIIIGQKRKVKKNKIPFQSIYEEHNKSLNYKETDLFHALNLKKDIDINYNNKNYSIVNGFVELNDNSNDPWSLSNTDSKDFINKILKNSSGKFSDIAKIKVGIKTTADKVFIKNKKSDFNIYENESNLILPLVSAKNCTRWKLNDINDLKYILYPYQLNGEKNEVIQLNDFPMISDYLFKHKDILTKREYIMKSGKKWFEIWVPQQLKEMNKPKIIFKDISEKPYFLIDKNQLLVNGNCFWIVLKDNIQSDLLYLLLGLANSELMERFHRIQFNNKLYSGKLRYNTQYVNNYPIPSLDSSSSNKIIKLVKKLVHNSNTSYESNDIIKKINLEVYKSFGIEHE